MRMSREERRGWRDRKETLVEERRVGQMVRGIGTHNKWTHFLNVPNLKENNDKKNVITAHVDDIYKHVNMPSMSWTTKRKCRRHS